MRPIKFRVWDKISKTMLYYDNDIVPLMTLNGVLVDAGMNGHSTNVSYRFILMQFTGLKDKNGKEIYEGDKIRGTNTVIMEIVQLKYGYGLKWHNQETNGEEIEILNEEDDYLFDGDCEVVGTVHDPEQEPIQVCGPFRS